MKRRYKILNVVLAGLLLVVVGVGITLSYTDDCEPAAALASDVESMQAIVRRCYGGPEVLELAQVEKPQPGPKDVLVRVEAAAVNPLDYHFMRGSPYIMRLMTGIGRPHDTRMGVDFAGVVAEVGAEVARFSVGDAVFGSTSGAFAEYVLIDEHHSIAHRPIGVSAATAAAVPVAALTALQALRDHGQLQAGQKVLINGASGGVGTYAVQIAKSMGAEVHGVCSTGNVDMVRALGADRVFDYTQENYTDSAEQYDLIVDMVGNHALRDNVAVMQPGGRMVLVGGPKGNWIAPFRVPLKALFLGPFVDQEFITLFATMNGDDLATVAQMLADNEVTSRLDHSYPLAATVDAIRYLETQRARGKVIIRPTN